MRRRRLQKSALTLCFVLAATGACGKKNTGSGTADNARTSESTASESAPPDGSAKAAIGNTDGRFTYKVEPAHDDAYKRIEPLFTSGRMEGIVKAMGVFVLPKNVPVVGTDAGPCKNTVNAFYTPDKHSVFFCFAFADAIFEAFMKAGKTPEEASKLSLDAITFLAFHEMGHALINELGLAVTGKEEDAVDELAAIILIDNKKPDWAIAGTLAMTLLTANLDQNHPTYFDEHSLSPQRLGDILCMIYGSDPKKFSDIEKSAEIKPRLAKCAGFYRQKEKAWATLLEPHERGANR